MLCEDAFNDRYALENTWKAARATHFLFHVVRRNICLEVFMVDFQFCAVLSVPFFFKYSFIFFICDFKSPCC